MDLRTLTATGSVDWDAYLSAFHAQSPGITEDILRKCVSNGLNPYQWLTQGLDADAQILDLGCGSGPAMPSGSLRWAGLDLSRTELQRASEQGRDRLTQGDITELPYAPDSFDVVTCSMAMMLVHPLEAALQEVSRVLRPAGELRMLLPTAAPLTTRDRLRYLRMFWAARSTTKFPPTPLRSRAVKTLEASGYAVSSDDRMRFGFPLRGAADAALFINSWYLPNVSEARKAAARHSAEAMTPMTIGVPLRRIIAQPNQAHRRGLPGATGDYRMKENL